MPSPPPTKFSDAAKLVAIVTALYAVVAFVGLGDVAFFGDEGIVAVGSKRVLEHGYPMGWDGVNLFSFEAGHDLNNALVQKRLPWLAFYIGALGQALFGSNTFGARFGFTLCGVLNLPLLYWVARRLGLARRVGVTAVLILAALPGYFLYIRQSYHYASDVTLSLVGLAIYCRIERRWNPVLLALCVVALFHLNYLSAMWFALTLTAWAAWDGRLGGLFRRRSVWAAVAISFVGTYGWIRWASVVEFQDSIGGWGTLLPHPARLHFVLSELDMSFPLLFTLPVLWLCGMRSLRDATLRPLFRLTTCAFLLLMFFGGYEYGWLRFFLFIFPLLALVWAELIVWIAFRPRGNFAAATAIAAVMFLTTLPYHVSHGILGAVCGPAFAKYQMSRVMPEGDTRLWLSPILVDVPSELAAPPFTQMNEVVRYLNKNATPGQQIVSLCDSETLQFETKLITAYLVDPRQRTYARVSKLPSYVASYRDADWLLLRTIWRRNYGMSEIAGTDQNQEILDQLKKDGVTLERIPLRVREHFPNQLPTLFGHCWATDYGTPTMELYRVRRKGNGPRPTGDL